LRVADYHGQGRVSFATVAVLHETLNLVRTSLVVQTTGEPVVLRDLTPGRLAVAGMGALLVKLMGLGQIDPAEGDTLAALLR